MADILKISWCKIKRMMMWNPWRLLLIELAKQNDLHRIQIQIQWKYGDLYYQNARTRIQNQVFLWSSFGKWLHFNEFSLRALTISGQSIRKQYKYQWRFCEEKHPKTATQRSHKQNLSPSIRKPQMRTLNTRMIK